MRAYILTEDVREETLLIQALRLASMHGVAVSTLEQLSCDWETDPGDCIILASSSADPVADVRTIRHTMIAPLIAIVDPLTEQTHVEMLAAGADIVLARPVPRSP